MSIATSLAVAVERAREAARPLPARILRFPPLAAARSPDLVRVADQTVERDWRQAMPCAEPARSLAPLPVLAVVGAAAGSAGPDDSGHCKRTS